MIPLTNHYFNYWKAHFTGLHHMQKCSMTQMMKLFILNEQRSENTTSNSTCSFLAVSLLEIIPLSSFCFLWSLIKLIILFSKLPFIITCTEKINWYKAKHYKFLSHNQCYSWLRKCRNLSAIQTPTFTVFCKCSKYFLWKGYFLLFTFASYALLLEIKELIPYCKEDLFTSSRKLSMSWEIL